MAQLQTIHCVEIRVPEEGSKEDMGFGSGYTLEPNWVLTSCHVLFDGADLSKPIEITWWDETGKKVKEGKSLTVKRKKIVWYSKQHDIALIKCKLPYKDVPSAWTVLDEKLPKTGAECRCGGYLSNLFKSNGEQRRKTPRGEFGLFSPEEIWSDINGLEPALEVDGDWAGFSGSPVFSGHKLTAIVKEVNEGERGAGLTACFIASALDSKGGKKNVRLRDVPGFLDPPGNDHCWQQHRNDVITGLNDKNVFTVLAKAYEKTIQNASPINNAQDLADALYNATLLQAIQCFHLALSALIDQQQITGVTVIKNLGHIWLALLTAEQRGINGIESYKNDPTVEPFAITAGDPPRVDIEGQAANGENRSPQLELKGQHLRSPFDLTPEHETGLDERQAEKDIKNTLLQKNKPGYEVFSLTEAKDTLEEFALRKSGLVGPIAPDDNVKRGNKIGIQVKWANLKGSHYIRIPEQEGHDDQSSLRKIHQWCCPLLVFEVSKMEDSDREEWLTGIHRLIIDAQEFLAKQNS